ncbi:hypothetical protein JOD54_001707 [Actinokineospora baliensis]|uniref:hypothetical protein n=1 Tax=Actinokineospora baliensis TaxID=547056 RepID=UPI00195D02CB|nr:hypothetical protein [Actinokineospora baliensis]MBM7771503.1 hypothetical protein [Actinokineospora baliensis]
MSAPEPSEMSVLLKVVEAVELKIRSSAAVRLPEPERTHITQIVAKFEPGSAIGAFIQDNGEGPMMGDTYNVDKAGAVGKGAMAFGVSFGDGAEQKVDLTALAAELGSLREAMRKESTTVDHDIAVAEVAQAERSATAGDGAEVVSRLAKAGEWALKCATAIGAPLAVVVLKSALGL